VPSVPVKANLPFALRIFGFDITRAKAGVPTNLSQPSDRGGWWPTIREPFTGAWQRNKELRNETVLTYNAVYSCVTLIASDVSKMCVRLVEMDLDGIWNEVSVAAFSPVLRKPNRYQNRIKFIEQWVVSKLLHGNTYVLKQRDSRGVVVAMYILDPTRTKPLVAPDGSIYYQLSQDNLSGIDQASVAVPASEIIHDTMVPLYHPLCGVSPLYACGVAAMQGLSIQNNATRFFENGAMPGGVLTAPSTIDDVTAKRLKDHWESNYSGVNAGRVAVLGDGLKYEKMIMTAVESQMIEQLKWTGETVCSCFHVPAYMVGIGAAPAYNNIEALNQQYYSQCLQAIIESIELCLDEGLGLVGVQGHTYGTEFDLDDLLRMDTATQYKTYGDGIIAGLMAPDEGRKKIGLKPVPGGATPYLQQQNYSLAALAKRDALADPFATAPASKPETLPPVAEDVQSLDAAAAKQIAEWSLKQSLDSLPALNLLAA
jgi:HK97 family phage portal protein